MLRRKFGATDLQVSALGFGCAALGSRTGTRDSVRAVSAALDAGINFFDTAPVYGQGESERILGRVIQGNRDKAIVATKIGIYPGFAMRMAAKVKPMVRSVLATLSPGYQRRLQKSLQGFMRGGAAANFDPGIIVASVEGSLKRLQTDCIDLLLLHTTPAPEIRDDVIDRLIRLRDAGKITYFGASSHSRETTDLWLNLGHRGIGAVQVMLNLMDTATVREVTEASRRLGMAIIAREPLAQGRLIPPRPSHEKGLGFIGEDYNPLFESWAVAHGMTVPELALRYLVSTPGVDVVIAGMTTVAHLKHNVDAVNRETLTESQRAELGRISETGLRPDATQRSDS